MQIPQSHFTAFSECTVQLNTSNKAGSCVDIKFIQFLTKLLSLILKEYVLVIFSAASVHHLLPKTAQMYQSYFIMQ